MRQREELQFSHGLQVCPPGSKPCPAFVLDIQEAAICLGAGLGGCEGAGLQLVSLKGLCVSGGPDRACLLLCPTAVGSVPHQEAPRIEIQRASRRVSAVMCYGCRQNPTACCGPKGEKTMCLWLLKTACCCCLQL